ncbi:MAG: hypothetical protein ACRETK_05115 [Steroidobacteraceae bacterium]
MNDPSVHRQTWDLIPWIVNGSAPDEQVDAVSSHLQSCADCGEELALQRQLQQAIRARPVPQLEPEAGWQALQGRLGQPRPARAADPAVRRNARRWLPWAVAAMLAEAMMIGALTAVLLARSPSATLPAVAASSAYRTLASTDPTPAAATIRLVLSPSMTLARMQALLQHAGLQVVAGPGDAGVWSLAPAGSSSRAATAVALQRLRADSGVRFAEPIGGAP